MYIQFIKQFLLIGLDFECFPVILHYPAHKIGVLFKLLSFNVISQIFSSVFK